MSKQEIKPRSYTLYDKNGQWLGQIVLTDDGMFASVTDYGNLSYAWRAFGDQGFREFLIGLNVDYFATKMFAGMSYILHTKQSEKACNRFAEKILPPLQAMLKQELTTEES